MSLTEDQELVSQVHHLFNLARNARRPITEQWKENWKALWFRPSSLAAATNRQLPEILPIVASITAWETDSEPTFDVTPYAPSHSPYWRFYNSLSNDLATIMRAVYQDQSFSRAINRCVWNMNAYSLGILKTGWDDSLAGGLGDIVLKAIDPFTLYIDPSVTDPYDANYFIEVRTMSMQSLERMVPDVRKKLTGSSILKADQAPSIMSESEIDSNNNASAYPATRTEGNLNAMMVSADMEASLRFDSQGVTLMEAWLRDRMQVDREPDYGPDTHLASAHERAELEDGEEPERDKEWVDTWRRVLIVGNVLICDDDVSELWSHGDHPYAFAPAMDDGSLYTPSMVEGLISSQRSINNLARYIERNIEITGNPKLLHDDRAGIKKTALTSTAGEVVRTHNVDAIKYVQPPQLHPDTMQFLNFHINEMERNSGLSAIIRGATPTGRNAQGVMDAVQDSAFVRIRAVLRNLEDALHVAGNKNAANICEFYDTPRMVAFVGPSGEETALTLGNQHFYVPTEHGRVPMRFQLSVQAGSMLPQSRDAQIELAQSMFALHAIDEEAVLEATNFPGRRFIVERMQAKQAQEAQMAMMGAQGGGSGPNAREASRR